MNSNHPSLKTTKIQTAIATSLICGTIACAPNVMAQGITLEEVIVTARKVEESLQDAPVAVTALTGEELENRGAVDLTDIGAASPNVSFEAAASTGGLSSAPTVFIRGIGQSDFNITTDPAVGVYVDGVYLGRSLGSLVDLLDIERAEVLRGPQGTLFGRNSIGGAVNLISRKPDTDALSGDASLTFGENGYVETKVKANIPLSDTTAARISAFKRERDGYVEAVQYDDFDLGNEDVWGVSTSLRFTPTDNLTIDFNFDYSETSEAPAATIPVNLGNVADNTQDASGIPVASRFNSGTPFPPPLPAGFTSTDFVSCSTAVGRNTNPACFGNVFVSDSEFEVNSLFTDEQGNIIEPENEVDALGGNLSISWDTALGTFTSVTGYREFDARFFNDLDFTPFVIFHNINSEFEQNQFSQELQLAGQLSDSIQFVARVYYFKEEGLQSVSVLAPLLPPVFNSPDLPLAQVDFRDVENTSKAAFGQVTWHATDSLHLTLGLRYTEDEKDFDFGINIGTLPDQAATGSVDLSETTPLFSASYDITDDALIYASYSEGFRDGGFPARFVGLLPDELPSFNPEFVEAFEVGAKTTWLDGKLRLNVAAFQTNYDDIQVAASSPALLGAPTITNLASAKLTGVELELSGVVTDNLRVDITGGYLKDEIRSIVGGQLNAGGTNTPFIVTEDNDLPNTPEFNFTVGASHILNFSSGASIRSRVDWIWTDFQNFRIENTEGTSQDAYSRVNASVTYLEPNDRWEFTLGARNLTDEVWSTAGGITPIAGSTSRNVSRPREVYASFKYRFGPS